MSPVMDPMAWKEDVSKHPWDHLKVYIFPPFVIKGFLNKVRTSEGPTVLLVALLWPEKKWFPDVFAGGATLSTSSDLESFGSSTSLKVPSRTGNNQTSHMEVFH